MIRMMTALGVVALAGGAQAQTVGFVETFTNGVGDFGGGSSYQTPLGGADGPGDAFLEVSNATPGQLGARVALGPFTGDLTGAGATAFTFDLRDTGADDDLNVYLGVGTAFTNFWIYNVPFTPTDDVWTSYTVPLVDDGNWVRTQGGGTLAEAFANSNRLLFRHDSIGTPTRFPEAIAGEFGLDNVALVPTPGALTALGFAGLALARRRR